MVGRALARTHLPRPTLNERQAVARRGARSDAHGDLPNPPSTYLKRVWVDTIVFTTHQLEALVKVFGADKVMMGTDYPFDMGEYDPIGHVVETGLDPEVTKAVVGGTAARLFGMGG